MVWLDFKENLRVKLKSYNLIDNLSPFDNFSFVLFGNIGEVS